MKACTKCKVEKELAEFSKRTSASDGLRSCCKECDKKSNKEYCDNNKDKIKEYRKQWSEDNSEKISEQRKEYYENHKSESKEYYENNKEYYKEYQKQWWEEHKEKLTDHRNEYRENHKSEAKQYCKTHRKELNENARRYHNERKHTNINYNLTRRLRHRLWNAIKGNCKSKKTLELLGCSIEELKQHLESQFYNHKITGESMTWEKYGRFHIDHIIPCATFVLENSEEQEICFHYTNLQPLWAEDNLKKSDKLNFDLFTNPTPKYFEKIYEEK